MFLTRLDFDFKPVNLSLFSKAAFGTKNLNAFAVKARLVSIEKDLRFFFNLFFKGKMIFNLLRMATLLGLRKFTLCPSKLS